MCASTTSTASKNDDSNNNNNDAKKGNATTTDHVDHDAVVRRLADRQAAWRALGLAAKAQLLQAMLDRVCELSADEYVEQLGKADAAVMGFRVADAPDADDYDNDEAEFEATQSAFTYAVIVQGALQKLLLAYQVAAGLVQSPVPTLEVAKESIGGRTTVQTMPVLPSDKFGPFAKIQTHVWLAEGVDGDGGDDDVKPFRVQETLDANNRRAENGGCTVVLGAGNHCFLSAVDCLHGLFVENSVVLLKHHPLRGLPHDAVLRHIFQPLVERGFFDTVLDPGNVAATQAILYHPLTTKVHLTGGKAAHDAIVWGDNNNDNNKKAAEPKLQATMTSELGCVTPWIVAPHFVWTEAQLDHQVRHLQAALYNNAGANCNSPKVVILGRDWPQAKAFVSRLRAGLARAPPPVAYYPGSPERWNAFRRQYPDAVELGSSADDDDHQHPRRPLRPHATVLPWLFIDNIEVDLSTCEGRARTCREYAFRHEPFAPVVTVAYVDGGLDAAVALANEHLFGSLSCTVVAPLEERDDELERAIADLKYGAIAVNTWSAMCYLPSGGGTWGAFPGETLDNVESGIGRINNYYFLPRVEKTVLRTPLVDKKIHSLPKHENFRAAANEQLATAQFLLRPGPLALLNLIAAATLGVQLPRPVRAVGAVYGWVSAKAASLLFWREKP